MAKHGRAKNLGERSRNHLDAGAVSTALTYAAYAETISKIVDANEFCCS
ncbi:MAG: hypothetical protein LBI18_01970 [Planctomycetaceae bacterium]|nr:hypothetical protein [Planctomycetaceae bacterium]